MDDCEEAIPIFEANKAHSVELERKKVVKLRNELYKEKFIKKWGTIYS